MGDILALLSRYLFLRLMLASVILVSAGSAQDLEPRAYSASPVGTTFAVVGFARSSGDIAFDPTVPITNAQATLYSPALGLGQTFAVFGRQALFVTGLPYAWGNASGDVGNNEQSVYRSGLADVKSRFSVILRGSPAMSPKEFMQRPHRNFIIGASLTFTAPAGQYSGEKLINIGTNRWSFKPEVGVSYPVKKLFLDLYAGSWFFMDNGNFYPGQLTRSQNPLPTIQGHVSYTLRHSMWVAVDSTWYGGGAATVAGGAPSERQSNSRLGATVSLPLAKKQSVKISYSSGVSGRIGSKFDTISVGWQHVWFDHH